MALVNNQQVIENIWTILQTDDLAEDNLLPNISLSDLLTRQNTDEPLNILLPISALLNIRKNSMGNDSLARETLKLIQTKSRKIAVWLDTEHNHANDYPASSQQLDDLLNATSKKAQKLNPLLADIVSELTLIVLNVPLFANGRAFSLAEHLRKQGYSGEIRLTGAFGRDQLPYYHRSGVDTFMVSEEELNKGDGQDEFFAIFNALANAPAGKDVNNLPMFRE
ncbi:DUF934 domain-containing protein [Psychrobacter sp. HD31]|uniref:DUF934 domain-containing protein n=1 Tax=Psychrobacter sp. HD31 TaxID=3112003 RepID=UPI003DA49CA1